MKTPNVPMPYYYGFIFQRTQNGWITLESSTNGVSPVNPSVVANYICRMNVSERLLHRVVEYPCQIVFCDDVYTRDEMDGFNRQFFLNSLRAMSRILDILKTLCSEKMLEIHKNLEPTKTVCLMQDGQTIFGNYYHKFTSIDGHTFVKGTPMTLQKDGYKVILTSAKDSLDALILEAFKDKSSTQYSFLSAWFDLLITAMQSNKLKSFFNDDEDNPKGTAYLGPVTSIKINAATVKGDVVTPTITTVPLKQRYGRGFKDLECDVSKKEYAYKILSVRDFSGTEVTQSEMDKIKGAYLSVNKSKVLTLNILNTDAVEKTFKAYCISYDYVVGKVKSGTTTMTSGIDETLVLNGRVSKILSVVPNGALDNGSYNVISDCYTMNYDRSKNKTSVLFDLEAMKNLANSKLPEAVNANAYDGVFIINYEVYIEPEFGITMEGDSVEGSYPQNDPEVKSYSALEVLLGENIRNSNGEVTPSPITLDEFFDSSNRKVVTKKRYYGHDNTEMTISLGGDISSSKTSMHLLNYYTSRLVAYDQGNTNVIAYNTIQKSLSYILHAVDDSVKLTSNILVPSNSGTTAGNIASISGLKSYMDVMLEKAKVLDTVLSETYTSGNADSEFDMSVKIEGSIVSLPLDTREIGTLYAENVPLLTIQTTKNFTDTQSYYYMIPSSITEDNLEVSTKMFRLTSYGLNKREGKVVYNGFITATTLDTPVILVTKTGNVLYKMYDPVV